LGEIAVSVKQCEVCKWSTGIIEVRHGPRQASLTDCITEYLVMLTFNLFAVAGHPSGAAHEVAVVHGMLANPACLATLLWVGLGPGALAAFLQASGQKVVPPAQAQVGGWGGGDEMDRVYLVFHLRPATVAPSFCCMFYMLLIVQSHAAWCSILHWMKQIDMWSHPFTPSSVLPSSCAGHLLNHPSLGSRLCSCIPGRLRRGHGQHRLGRCSPHAHSLTHDSHLSTYTPCCHTRVRC
jgi:hypothetical protein